MMAQSTISVQYDAKKFRDDPHAIRDGRGKTVGMFMRVKVFAQFIAVLQRKSMRSVTRVSLQALCTDRDTAARFELERYGTVVATERAGTHLSQTTTPTGAGPRAWTSLIFSKFQKVARQCSSLSNVKVK